MLPGRHCPGKAGSKETKCHGPAVLTVSTMHRVAAPRVPAFRNLGPDTTASVISPRGNMAIHRPRRAAAKEMTCHVPPVLISVPTAFPGLALRVIRTANLEAVQTAVPENVLMDVTITVLKADLVDVLTAIPGNVLAVTPTVCLTKALSAAAVITKIIRNKTPGVQTQVSRVSGNKVRGGQIPQSNPQGEGWASWEIWNAVRSKTQACV